MAIYEQINDDMKAALRAGEKLRLSTLRSVRAAFLNRMKQDNSESVSDEECRAMLRRLEKQRRESIEAFESAGRTEQAAAERAELEVIQTYLPSLADEATTRRWVEEAIAASGEIDGYQARTAAQELLAEESSPGD